MRQDTNVTVEAEARRQEIVVIAARLFHDRGYHRTSMSDIAEAANLAKPSLYHYVRSKDELLAEIHSMFMDPLLQKAQSRSGQGLEPEAELREIIFDIIDLNRSLPGFVRVFHEYVRDLPEGVAAEIQRKRDKFEGQVADVITSIIGDGLADPVKRRVVVLSVFGVCNWAYHWYRPDGPLDSRSIADLMTDFALHGLRGLASGDLALKPPAVPRETQNGGAR
jgi:AcrR family transcriptional regulator